MGFWSNSFKFGLYDFLMPANYDRSIEEAFRLLGPTKSARIADFGCGSGRLLIHAKRWLEEGGSLEGFDIDESAVKAASARAVSLGLQRQTNFQQTDLTQASDLGGPFEGGVAHFSLYTLGKATERMKALQQMAKHLKAGATIVVSVPSEHYRIATIIDGAKRVEDERRDISPISRALRRNMLYKITGKAMMKIEKALDAGTFHRFTSSDLTQLIESAGFKTESVTSGYSGCGYHAVARRL